MDGHWTGTLNNADRRFYAAFALVAVLASVVHFHELGAMHVTYDEGVHADVTRELVTQGTYRYSGGAHGPLLIYLSALSTFVSDLTIVQGRALVAALSLLTLPALLPLRRVLNDRALLVAAPLVTLHPVVLFPARYYRNDAILVTILLAAVALYVRYRATGSAWTAAATGVLLAAAIATKEVAYIVLFALVVPLVAAILVASFRDRDPVAAVDEYIPLQHAPVGLFAFVVTLVAFFAGWPPRPQNALVYIATGLDLWFSRMGGDPRYGYFTSQLLTTAPLVTALGIVGLIDSLRPSKRRLVRWLLISWTVVLFAVFFQGSEYARWLVIYITAPLAILAGIGVVTILNHMGRHIPTVERRPLLPVGAALAIVLLAALAWPMAVPGLTAPTQPDDTSQAFQATAAAHERTGCEVVVGPGYRKPFPLKWYVEGEWRYYEPDGGPTAPAVVVTQEPVSTPYATEETRVGDWMVIEPQASC